MGVQLSALVHVQLISTGYLLVNGSVVACLSSHPQDMHQQRVLTGISDHSLFEQYLNQYRNRGATSTPIILITKKVLLGVSLRSPLSNFPYLVTKE